MNMDNNPNEPLINNGPGLKKQLTKKERRVSIRAGNYDFA
jgi:hypothetical protein